jgi:hypothetical protein
LYVTCRKRPIQSAHKLSRSSLNDNKSSGVGNPGAITVDSDFEPVPIAIIYSNQRVNFVIITSDRRIGLLLNNWILLNCWRVFMVAVAM